MGIDLDLTKIPNNKAIAIVLIVFISIFGPFLCIFLNNEPLFKSYNLVTLLLISASIGFPIVVFNTLAIIASRNALHKEILWPKVGIFSSMMTFFPFYSGSVLGYLKNWPLKKVIKVIGLTEASIYISFSMIFLIGLLLRQRKHSTNTPTPPADPLPPSPHPESPSGT